MIEVMNFLRSRMDDSATQWSLGTFGAIAEFARGEDEAAAVNAKGGQFSAVTSRGGIRLETPDDLRLFASESPTRESWSQRVALCLPEERCAMSRRGVLTELGPDDASLREQDRGAVLFDLGLGALQTDICVRVADRDLAARLRECAGRPVFDPQNPAMGAILAASPHRVFISPLGRIEVYQPIPPANGKSPDGPHTHVLPKLLQHSRSHPATEPVPEGFVPCAHCYPSHPAKDALGEPRPFDADAHRAFQAMLGRFGDPALITLKQQVADAIAAGAEPAAVAVTNKRFARASVRIALRQLAAAGKNSHALAAWRATHDAATPETEPSDPYGHMV
jgi:hypothetical protein